MAQGAKRVLHLMTIGLCGEMAGYAENFDAN